MIVLLLAIGYIVVGGFLFPIATHYLDTGNDDMHMLATAFWPVSLATLLGMAVIYTVGILPYKAAEKLLRRLE